MAASSTIVLEYPASYGWIPASSAPSIPGLPLTHTFILAPAGQATQVRLVAGQVVDDKPSPLRPLPALAFATDAHLLPKAEVVSLLDTQAYRYSQSSSPKTSSRLTIYAIPYTVGPTTAIACYAPLSDSTTSDMQTCEQIVAQLTLQGGAQSQVPLTPEPIYAHELSGIVSRLDRLRISLRPEMRSQTTRATLASIAGRLASGLADAKHSLTALQPPAAAEAAHTALSGALSGTREAYLALAATASAGRASQYATARGRVYEAEARINTALQGFAMIGYA